MKKIFLGLLILIGLTAAYLFLEIKKQPEYFRVQKSTSIKAPVENIYSFLSSEDRFSQWSPWANTKNKVRATVSNRIPLKQVDLALEFSEPTSYKAASNFFFITQPDSTIVVWGINGHNASWKEKLYFRFKNQTAQIDHDLDMGLERIKKIVEAIVTTKPTIMPSPTKRAPKAMKPQKKKSLKK